MLPCFPPCVLTQGCFGISERCLAALVTPESGGCGSSNEVLNLVDLMRETLSPVQGHARDLKDDWAMIANLAG